MAAIPGDVVAEGQYDVRYWVKDVPSLIFWFKAIAGANEVPADFSVATHHGVVNALIRQYGSQRGLATNEHRTLVIAHKPEASWDRKRMVETGTPLNPGDPWHEAVAGAGDSGTCTAQSLRRAIMGG